MFGDYRLAMRRRGLTDSTIQGRLAKLKDFSNWLGRDVLTATAAEIETFLDTKKGRNGQPVPRTRYNWISHLSSYYRWAVDHELIERDPTVKVDRPKLSSLLPRPIPEGDLSMALEMAETNRTMHPWLTLGAYAGLRCSEIAGLTADAVLLNEGLLRIVGKGNKERVVPCHPRVTKAILSYGLPKRGHVFRRPRGSRWYANGVSREGAMFFESLGMPWRMHSLRHRFATRALAACGNLRTVQELLGHASPSTTAGYAQYSSAAGREAVLGIDRDGSPLIVPLPFAAGD